LRYDDLILDRLTQTKIYPSKMRKGLGRHVRKDDVLRVGFAVVVKFTGAGTVTGK